MLAISIVTMMLPASPFLSYLALGDISSYLPYINYFVPVDRFVVMTETWLAALMIWFALLFGRKAITTCTDIVPFM
jgi:hypothetical protein